VKREEKWLRAMQLRMPSSFDFSDLKSYADLIFQNADGKCVLKNQPFLLASDLASIAGKGWLTHSVLAGLVNIMQKDAQDTIPFILSDLLMMDEEARKRYLAQKVTCHTKGIAFIVNVGKTSSGVFTSSPKSQPGCHWTFLFVDILENNWYYCDSNCWNIPDDLSLLAAPIVEAAFEAIGRPFSGSPSNIFKAHHSKKGGEAHTCSEECLHNVPIQTCSNVCGVSVSVLASIACFSPILWKEKIISRKDVLPLELDWLRRPTDHSDFLRCCIISWLIKESVDITSIGITKEYTSNPDPVEDVAVDDVTVEDVTVEDVTVEDGSVEDVTVEDVTVEDDETVKRADKRKTNDENDKREKAPKKPYTIDNKKVI